LPFGCKWPSRGDACLAAAGFSSRNSCPATARAAPAAGKD
jgi:hypothetical protein